MVYVQMSTEERTAFCTRCVHTNVNLTTGVSQQLCWALRALAHPWPALCKGLQRNIRTSKLSCIGAAAEQFSCRMLDV